MTWGWVCVTVSGCGVGVCGDHFLGGQTPHNPQVTEFSVRSVGLSEVKFWIS